jgi:hypothetical protein
LAEKWGIQETRGKCNNEKGRRERQTRRQNVSAGENVETRGKFPEWLTHQQLLKKDYY